MRFLKELFRRRPNNTDEVLNSIYGSVTSPIGEADAVAVCEFELMRIARQRKGHLSNKAVFDEYNRLLANRSAGR